MSFDGEVTEKVADFQRVDCDGSNNIANLDLSWLPRGIADVTCGSQLLSSLSEVIDVTSGQSGHMFGAENRPFRPDNPDGKCRFTS